MNGLISKLLYVQLVRSELGVAWRIDQIEVLVVEFNEQFDQAAHVLVVVDEGREHIEPLFAARDEVPQRLPQHIVAVIREGRKIGR